MSHGLAFVFFQSVPKYQLASVRIEQTFIYLFMLPINKSIYRRHFF